MCLPTTTWSTSRGRRRASRRASRPHEREGPLPSANQPRSAQRGGPFMSRNEELFARAQRTIPGGVNSPVRAFRAVGGTPRFFARGEGAYVWDADGKRYIDYVGSWG